MYYTATFAFVWLAVAKVPRGLGLAASAQRFVTVMATVWAGSQVRVKACHEPATSLPRAMPADMLCLLARKLVCDSCPTSRLGLQVTKVPRAAAALVLAPIVDRLMAWLQRVTKLESRRQVGGGRRVEASSGAAAHPAPHPSSPNLAAACTAQVFGWFVACCLGLALTLFSVVVLAWA